MGRIIYIYSCADCPHCYDYLGSETQLLKCGLVDKNIPESVGKQIPDFCPLPTEKDND